MTLSIITINYNNCDGGQLSDMEREQYQKQINNLCLFRFLSLQRNFFENILSQQRNIL